MKCSVDGCEKGAKKKDHVCAMHRARMTRNGCFHTLKGHEKKAEPFLQNVILKFAGDECLVWPYGTNGDGYGRMTHKGKRVSVHRLVCELVNGAPPTAEYHAAHLCGNGHLGCVNPHHLRWKTPKDNCADTLIHGTHNRGENSGKAKLTSEQVLEICRRSKTDRHSDLAAEFGIHKKYINDLVTGRRWGHLNGRV